MSTQLDPPEDRPQDARDRESESALRQGASLSLRELFLVNHDRVWRLLRRLGVAEASVDDGVQEVFWVAARRLADIEPGRQRAFLYGVALRVASQEVRRQQASAARIVPEPEERVDPSPSPEAQVAARETRALLERVLGAMPQAQRELLVLFELEGLRAQDIAQIYGIPVGTATSRLRRARETFSAAAARLRATLRRVDGSSEVDR
ncbi:MAG: sigma-70 family RNA polymerase sigma factor [Myxococcales bacterium]|nr:sigma-70 family RNA polymerase sigma factor [Myxococcales bacterium]